MIRCLRHWLWEVALLGAAWTCAGADGQEVELPAPARLQPDVSARADDLTGSSLSVGNRLPPYVLPPVPGLVLCSPVRGDPLLNCPDAPLAAPYVNVEALLAASHLRLQVTTSVNTTGGGTNTVHFDGNHLDTTVSPRSEAGCWLPDGNGAVQLSYRFLTTSGSGDVQTAVGDNAEHGRFELNVFDLDYKVREFSLGPNWGMLWGAGFRAMTMYFDSRIAAVSPPPVAGTALEQAVSTSLRSYGPHALLDLSRKCCGVRGLAVFGRLEGAVLFGRIKQTVDEAVIGTPGMPVMLFENRQDGGICVPVGTAQLGLSYTVPAWNQSRFLIGYQYETWWNIGFLAGNRAQLDDQGLFLRAEINF
jgi:hypothetical protein